MEDQKLTFKVLDNIKSLDDIADAALIRDVVFIQEQKVPAEMEIDEYDMKATHVVMYYDNKPIGNGRIIYKEDEEKWYVGRIAIIKEFRGKSLGKTLMDEIMNVVSRRKIDTLYMHAQVQVVPFYEKLGWTKYGEKFEEAGIEHYHMSYKFSDN